MPHVYIISMVDENSKMIGNEFTPPRADFRSGMIAVVGRTNVGKSSLINALLDEKVSIVSSTEQTTRHMIRGIYTDLKGQLVFLDTPGLHHCKNALGQVMNRTAEKTAQGVDVILLVLDRSVKPRKEDASWIRRLIHVPEKVCVVLNKSDREPDASLAYQQLWEACCKEKGVEKEPLWLTVSALKKEGLEHLRETLMKACPEGPYLFPEEVLSDFPKKLSVADIIREQLYAYLTQELPHAVGVYVEEMKETPDRIFVRAIIYVLRHSQKGMVIGKKGRELRRAKQRSKRELETIYETPIELDLHVKVVPKWTENYWILKQMGLEEEKSRKKR